MEILNIQSSLLCSVYVSVLCVRYNPCSGKEQNRLAEGYGNYPPEATCGYSCKHKKTLEEDPSAFAFDEVYDDMKHRDIVPKLQDRQHLKLTCVTGSGKGVSGTPLHIANAELAPTHPICLGLALN
ncbi:hypothetical protein YC2023_079321 [Brassica napus]